jgi:hypothetical protein
MDRESGMSTKTPRPGPEPARATSAEKAAEARGRTERLKAALKANLGRRKAQARARDGGGKTED